MKGRTARILIVAGVVLTLLLAMAATALAAVHVTHGEAEDYPMSASLTSTGDAGEWHGNNNNDTSPLYSIGQEEEEFTWFNQDVNIHDVKVADTDGDNDRYVTGAWYWWTSPTKAVGPNVSFNATDGVTVSAEGLYSLTATSDEFETPGVPEGEQETDTIDPAFGIDKTKPVSFSDVVPFYDSAATVTITATDTISGVENVQYSKDGGPWDYSWEGIVGGYTTVPVTFGPGTHTLEWKAIDNAGNIDCPEVTFVVRPPGFIPNITLHVQRLATGKARNGTHIEHHGANFWGSVSPIAETMPLTLKVQKWSTKSKTYAGFKTFTVNIPMYTSSFSLIKGFTKDGKYRVMGMFDGGTTGWHTWTVN